MYSLYGESVVLSLLSKNGEVGMRSGLNWGQRPGRDPDQAYIPLPSAVAHSRFFPLGQMRFSVIADDGIKFSMMVEQQNDKAICTPDNNAILGEYFRIRLGLSSGVSITKAHLEAYGRTNVEFKRIRENHYFMDFSVD